MSRRALLTGLASRSLPETDMAALAGTVAGTRRYRRGACVVVAGQDAAHLHLITEGWAARQVTMEDGSRQISDLFLAGDFCDLCALGAAGSGSIVALSALEVTLVDRSKLLAELGTRPALALAFLRLALNQLAIVRTWLACCGSQEKLQHVAHLFCELHARLGSAGLVADHTFYLPLTQEVLADATAMTPVHANRVIQRMRKEGLISLHSHHLEILDPERLRKLAGFDDAYLAAG